MRSWVVLEKPHEIENPRKFFVLFITLFFPKIEYFGNESVFNFCYSHFL